MQDVNKILCDRNLILPPRLSIPLELFKARCCVFQTGVVSDGEKDSLIRKKVDETMFEVSFGKFQEWVCNHCGESFTDENTSRAIINR